MPENPCPEGHWPLTDEEIEEVLAQVYAMPSKPVKIRQFNIFERFHSWLFFTMIFYAEDIGEKRLLHMANVGKAFMDKQVWREGLIEKIIPEEAGATYFGEGLSYTREAVGYYNPTKFLDELSFLTVICHPEADYGEEHCMQYRLPIGRMFDIAVYMYRPVFYIDLFLALFIKREDN
jgi:hypothetical protein